MKLEREHLLAISEDIHRRYAPTLSKQAEPLTLLPVDPFHIGLCCPFQPVPLAIEGYVRLRLYCCQKAEFSPESSTLWLDSKLPAWPDYLHLPVPVDDTYYRAELGVSEVAQPFQATFASNIIDMPKAGIVQTSPATEQPFYNEAQIDALIQKLISATSNDSSDSHNMLSVEQAVQEIIESSRSIHGKTPNVYRIVENEPFTACSSIFD